jgi:crotonobetainyl-CoA:carnitine CoA-transferase CaiB-like acyl-CoA transferase
VGISRANVGDLVKEEPGLSIDEIRRSSRLLTVGGMTSSAQADGFASLGVASAMLLGVYARARGAGGQEMLTTMLNTGAHAMSAQVVDYPGAPPRHRPDPEMRGLMALYRIYDAADGWVFLAASADEEFAELAHALAPWTAALAEGRFATSAGREAHDAELCGILATVFAQRPKDDWETDMRAADVACVAVTTMAPEHMYWSDEFGRASGYLTDVVHPTFAEHPRMNFLRMSRSQLTPKAGVLAGSHTDRVLAELGFDDAAIADLRSRSIVA